MHLALVIPALNEEQAIAGTLRRCQAARETIRARTPVKQITIVFVNDGCTDGTQAIVDQPEFADVVKVNYGRNRGYGAAIKAGWQATDADLVGFMDADGTCDPEFCVNLINRLVQADADVVLAARLNPDTQMPLVRKLGNRIFATLLGVVSGHMNITDTASGFRIVKRKSLKLMSPLPDGLHFTPAMSCICLLDPRLKIEEVAGMLYKEREGRSKLSVIKDGFRFFWTIIFSACCYSPIKVMMGASVIVAALAGLVSAGLFAATGAVAGPFLVSLAAAISIMLLLGTGVVAHELNTLLIGPRRGITPAERWLERMLEYHRLIVGGPCIAAVAAIAMALVGLMARPLTPAFLLVEVVLIAVVVLGLGAGLTGVLMRVIWAVGEKQKALINDEYRVNGSTGGTTVPSVTSAARRRPELTASRPEIPVPSQAVHAH
ncbi:MAG: glycosyltransferase family 2 protein [Phycisphaeraceae bacterium]